MAATATEIRIVGLELQANVAALNTEVGAINTAVAAMNFKGLDGVLPTGAALAEQLLAYEALVIPTNTLTPDMAAVRGDAV